MSGTCICILDRDKDRLQPGFKSGNIHTYKYSPIEDFNDGIITNSDQCYNVYYCSDKGIPSLSAWFISEDIFKKHFKDVVEMRTEKLGSIGI